MERWATGRARPRPVAAAGGGLRSAAAGARRHHRRHPRLAEQPRSAIRHRREFCSGAAAALQRPAALGRADPPRARPRGVAGRRRLPDLPNPPAPGRALSRRPRADVEGCRLHVHSMLDPAIATRPTEARSAIWHRSSAIDPLHRRLRAEAAVGLVSPQSRVQDRAGRRRAGAARPPGRHRTVRVRLLRGRRSAQRARVSATISRACRATAASS